MLKKITIILSSFLLTLLVCLNVSATDMTVFGLKLGTKFDIAECERFDSKYFVTYKNAGKNICFARFPIRDKEGKEMFPTEPLVNEVVYIKFPLGEDPDIAAGDDVRAIIIDGNFEGAFFYTAGIKLDDFILAELKKKYGTPTKFSPSKVQNRLGASFDTFTASWTFDNLFVVFESVTDSLDRGEVTIDTKKSREAEEKRLKEVNKNKRVL